MKTILVVTGSIRPNSVNQKVVQYIEEEINSRIGIRSERANLAELSLPFFDAPTSPSVEGFISDHENVQQWSKLVSDADAVIMAVPEYNHGLSGVQKNAIDWLAHEWKNKPVEFVAYGFYAGKYSLDRLAEMSTVLGWSSSESPTGLKITEDIDLDGSVLDQEKVSQVVKKAVDNLSLDV